MQKIVPNLWFADAEEGGRFYADALPGATSRVTARYPEEGLLDFQREFAGQPLTVEVDIDGTRLVLIGAGDQFRPNPSISFMLNFDPSRDPGARERLDEVWSALADGGEVLMPLGEYPFSPRYGWLSDRYGVSWQLILTDAEGDPRPFVMPSLLFTDPARPSARAAMEFYTGLIPESEIGMIAPYDDAPDTVMFADFTLARQWFTAADSQISHDFTFGYGVSLQIDCADQAEIDRYWEALSSDPEAEQCGWCRDRFGVSWQVVPADMEQLTENPGAYAAMMSMKKIVIAELRAAAS